MKTGRLNLRKFIKEKDQSLKKPEILPGPKRKSDVFFGIIITAFLSFGLGLLFYGNLLFSIPLFGFFPLINKAVKSCLAQKRKRKLITEFSDGMKAYEVALRAGYSPETGIREAARDLAGIYGQNSEIVAEFNRILRNLSLGDTIESQLVSFGERTGIEEAREMGEVFSLAKRGGGHLPEVINRSVHALEEKTRIETEIQTLITGKKLEQRIMYLMPSGILLYVNLTGPDFIEILYTGLPGRLLMTAFLGVNAFAVYIGEKLMKVRI